jgi:hypothetical protein
LGREVGLAELLVSKCRPEHVVAGDAVEELVQVRREEAVAARGEGEKIGELVDNEADGLMLLAGAGMLDEIEEGLVDLEHLEAQGLDRELGAEVAEDGEALFKGLCPGEARGHGAEDGGRGGLELKEGDLVQVGGEEGGALGSVEAGEVGQESQGGGGLGVALRELPQEGEEGGGLLEERGGLGDLPAKGRQEHAGEGADPPEGIPALDGRLGKLRVDLAQDIQIPLGLGEEAILAEAVVEGKGHDGSGRAAHVHVADAAGEGALLVGRQAHELIEEVVDTRAMGIDEDEGHPAEEVELGDDPADEAGFAAPLARDDVDAQVPVAIGEPEEALGKLVGEEGITHPSPPRERCRRSEPAGAREVRGVPGAAG